MIMIIIHIILTIHIIIINTILTHNNIIIVIVTTLELPRRNSAPLARWNRRHGPQDSAKGGAVETECSGLHYSTGCFIL